MVVPQANAAEEAGKLIIDLPRLWSKANAEERRRLLLTMLDAVYLDAKKTKSIIAVKPKPPFKPVFQVAASREESDISIINEPNNGSSLFLVETGERACLKKSGVKSVVSDLKSLYGYHCRSTENRIRRKSKIKG